MCSGDSLHCTEMEGRSIDRDKGPLSAGLLPPNYNNPSSMGGVIGMAPASGHHSQMHPPNSAATTVAAHFAQGQHAVNFCIYLKNVETRFERPQSI